MLAYGFYYYDSALKAARTSTSKFAVPVLPNAVVMYLPFSGDELRPQSAVIDHSKHYRRRPGVLISQSPTSIGVVEVYVGGGATWNGCLVDGSVVGVLAVHLLILGDVDRLAIISVECQCHAEGQLA